MPVNGNMPLNNEEFEKIEKKKTRNKLKAPTI